MDGLGGVVGRAGAASAGGRCGRRGAVGPPPAEGARSGRGGRAEEPPRGPDPGGGSGPGVAEADRSGPDGRAPGPPAVCARLPGVSRSGAVSRDGGRVGAAGCAVSAAGMVGGGVSVGVSGAGADGSWPGGMEGRGGTGGRGGMEARRASVLMHPPFPRPCRPGGRRFLPTRGSSFPPTRRSSSVRTGTPRSSGCPAARGERSSRTAWVSPAGPADTSGKAIPVAADRHPRRGRPCVRVTLRVGPGRTGTSPRDRGFSPERPPTLR